MIVEKNTTSEEDEFYEYPYYIARIQRRLISTKRRWFTAQYPHHRFIIGELDNANRIHAFNRFEEEGYVERFQYHFGLIINLLHLPFTTDHNWLTSFFLYLVTGKELQINMSSA